MKKLVAFAATFLCLAVTARAANVSELTQKLKDRDTDNRRAAAQALAEMGAEAKSAVGATHRVAQGQRPVRPALLGPGPW